MKILFTGDYASSYVRGTVTPEKAKRALCGISSLLGAADFRVINLESIFLDEGAGAPIPKTGPNLRSEKIDYSLIEEGKFDLAVLANNHFGDFGPAGACAGLDYLEGRGLPYIGGGRNRADAYRSYIFEKDGMKVSLLAVCENEFGCATEEAAGSAGYDQKYLAERIAEEKAKADRVIVVFHGGNEYNPLPAPATVDRYRLVIDLGADALIAGHTHCMQGYEFYRGAPIVYSMGNFYFPHGRPLDAHNGWNYGYLSVLDVTREGITLDVHPYRLIGDEVLRLLAGEEREEVMGYISRLSSFIGDRAELTRYFEGWCLYAGEAYSHSLYWDPYFAEKGTLDHSERKYFAKLRNLFTCESHNYLMRTYLCLIMENRIREPEEYLKKVRALQAVPHEHALAD